MYFSAASNESAASGDVKHCVGAAISPNVTGPYTPTDSTVACDLEGGGSIDAAGFIDDDEDKTMYVVYKVDGSNLDSGDNVYPTPIMLQQVENDGITPIGSAVQLLDRDPNGGDGPLIEAPSLFKSDGIYYLTFSSAMFNTPQYDSSYAYATSITGPWTKQHSPYAPLLQTGAESSVGVLTGPGGSSFSKDGTKIAFHASRNGNNADDGRAFYVANITLGNDIITIL
jgi:beta-xylosidase